MESTARVTPGPEPDTPPGAGTLSSGDYGRPIVGRTQEQGLVVRNPGGTSAKVAVVVGGAVAIVGAVQIGSLWIPPRIGDLPWAYSLVQRSLDLVPLFGLGMVLAVTGVLRNPAASGVGARRAGVVLVVTALALIGFAALYAFALPTVVRSVPFDATWASIRAIVRDVTALGAYTIAFGAGGWLLLRGITRSGRT